ncbi:Haloacid dehalogenase-like hydrolase domain-containing protein 3 [Lamellibrachia satsuma]|nr:Haloacid dehalogenase-like hydrolase domain-containing protein 3 [Lamellibrachia satsuma]
MSRIRLLTFDVTNTLLRLRTSPGREYANVAKTFDVNVGSAELDRVYKNVWAEKKSDHPIYGLEDGLTTKQWWADLVSRVFCRAGYAGSPVALEMIADKLHEEFSAGKNWEIVPFAVDVLKELRDRGLKLGVVSNFDDRLEDTLLTHRLLHYFDFVVTTVSARSEKPDPAIFHAALDIAKIDPGDAGHVGDDVIEDYWAARNVGMHAFLLDRKGDAPRRAMAANVAVRPSCVMRELDELVKILDSDFTAVAETLTW